MAIISRHSGAPFQDGEILAGADLESDFSTIYTAFNGNIDAANLKDASVTTAKLADASVTIAKLADGAVTMADGSVTASKLANLAVITTKIAALAVTQDKIADGSATGSEVGFIHADATLTSSYQTLGGILTHTVGNPARHVIIIASCHVDVTKGVGSTVQIDYQLLKDDVSILGAGNIESLTRGLTTVTQEAFPFTRIYVDAAPQAGGSHTYKFQMKQVEGTFTVSNATVAALEPRR